jgi:hypothetical protein
MTKADWITIAGYLVLCVGLAMIYRPLAVIAAGAILLLIARASAAQPPKSGE